MSAELRPASSVELRAPLAGEIVALHKERVSSPILLTVLPIFFLALPGIALLAESAAVGAGFVAVAAALTGFIWWRHVGARLIVRDDGIEQQGRFGRKLVRWSELASFQFRAYQPNAMAYGGGLVGVLVVAAVQAATRGNTALPARTLSLTLVGRDGTRMKIRSGVKDFEKLLAHVSDMATRHLVPSTIERFEAGETVAFGNQLFVKRGVGVTWRGLFGTRTLPFQEIEPAQMIQQVRFVLRRRGGRRFLSVSVSSLPNLYVLVQLLNHARDTLALPSSGGQIQPVLSAPIS